MGAIFRGRKCYTGKVREQPVYSTDEMCIGYIDINGARKKLYQKTFRGAITAQSMNITDGVPAIVDLYEVSGSIANPTATTPACVPIGFCNIENNQYVSAFINRSVGVLGIRVSSGYTSTYNYLINIKYTKN